MPERAARLHKFLFIVAMVVIYAFGSYASLSIGLTWDEMSEAVTAGVNLGAVEGVLRGDAAAYRELLEYNDRYYGVGFHVPALLPQWAIAPLVEKWFGVAGMDAVLLAKHWVVFTLFFLSGFLVRQLMRRCTRDAVVSDLATVGYLLWPYMFGHAMMNVKDIPFMVAWLLCTGHFFALACRYADGRVVGKRQVFLLAIFTGWLISIRYVGLLVFVQYAAIAFFFRDGSGRHAGMRTPFMPANLLVFAFTLLVFSYIAYPVFWANPFEVINVVRDVREHTTVMFFVCTQTYGHCANGVPPAYYIPAWLLVKLPVIVLAGYLMLPWAFMNMAGRHGEPAMRLLKAAAVTVLVIPLLLIVGRVTIYNEVRHILFLMPFFYLIGILSWYFLSRRAVVAALLLSSGIFVADHFLAFPYQYVWFNEVARQFKVDAYFETEYWGASSRALADRLAIEARRVGPLDCVYGDPRDLIRIFLPGALRQCYRSTYELTPASPRPSLVASFSKTAHAVDCPVVHREQFRLFLGKGRIYVGKVQYCK